MQEIKWGIIGSGNVVKKSGLAFNMVSNSSIVAIMGRNKESVEDVSKTLKINNLYYDINEFLNHKNMNAVYIATPPGSHLEYAKKCCEAKLPTYIEKPIARNYQEALQIVNMFKEANVPLYVAHFYRALPKFIKIKELLDKGAIGKICEVDFKLDRRYFSSTLDTWLYDTEISGGGKFYDIAPHAIDIMIYLFGKFVKVNGIATNNVKEYDVEDIVVMSFKTDRKIIGTANFNSIALEKSDNMVINGTKGKIEFSIHDNSSVMIITEEGKQEIVFDNEGINQFNMIKNVVQSLIIDKSLNSCTGEEALETYRIMDEVLEEYYNGRDNFWTRKETWNK